MLVADIRFQQQPASGASVTPPLGAKFGPMLGRRSLRLAARWELLADGCTPALRGGGTANAMESQRGPLICCLPPVSGPCRLLAPGLFVGPPTQLPLLQGRQTLLHALGSTGICTSSGSLTSSNSSSSSSSSSSGSS